MKHNKYIIFIFLICIGCKNDKNDSMNMSSGYEEKILREYFYQNGEKKIISKTGLIGGEGYFLKTEEFNSNGQLIKSYGYEPYGTKYMITKEYVDSLIVKETRYVYSIQDSSYKYLDFYLPKDTLIEYMTIDSFISNIMEYKYYENSILKEKIDIIPPPKNIVHCDEVEVRFITHYNLNKQIIGEFVLYDSLATNWEIRSYNSKQQIESTKYRIDSQDCNYPKDTIVEKLTHKEIRVNRRYIEGCETGQENCSKIIIDRKRNEPLFLFIPDGGFSTSKLIEQGKIIDEIESTKFELTELHDGTYSVSILSCNLGGTFEIEIKTK